MNEGTSNALPRVGFIHIFFTFVCLDIKPGNVYSYTLVLAALEH